MVETVFINVHAKMEENVTRETDIAFVKAVTLVLNVNLNVRKERLDIFVCKNVNVEIVLIAILGRVNWKVA